MRYYNYYEGDIMNKAILALMLVGAVLSHSAQAARAKSAVFGTGDGGLMISKGTLYYNDDTNLFYNPAYVNDYKNFAVIEKQTSNAVGTAEGGFFTSLMNYNLGFYFNRGGFQNGATYQNVGVTSTIANMHPLEFFVGGENMGVKWGGSLSYGSYKVSNANNGAFVAGSPVSGIPFNNQNTKDVTLKGGFTYMELEPFFAYKLNGTDTYQKAVSPSLSSTSVTDKNKGWNVGARYRFGEWTPWAMYDYKKKETGDLAGSNVAGSGGYYWNGEGLARTASNDARQATLDNFSNPSDPVQKTIGFGMGRTMQATEAVKVHYGVAYVQQKTEKTSVVDGGGNNLKDTSGARASVTTLNGVAQDQTRKMVPIQIGVEGEATSWLNLRAGLQYRLMDNVSTSDGVAGTQADRTSGRVGATLKFSKLDFDWAIGNNSGAANTENLDAGTFALDNGLFTMASLTYRW